jgi:hypothetical protein
LKAFRLALARALSRQAYGSSAAFCSRGVLLLDCGATLVFRDSGRVDTRKGRLSLLN